MRPLRALEIIIANPSTLKPQEQNMLLAVVDVLGTLSALTQSADSHTVPDQARVTVVVLNKASTLLQSKQYRLPEKASENMATPS